MPGGSWRAADEAGPTLVAHCYRCHSHSHTPTHTAQHSQSSLHCAGGYGVHTSVRMCMYSSWWLMRGKSRWVKTTSVRCNVWEVIIYGLCTKLPSNSALFTTAIPYRETSICAVNLVKVEKKKKKKGGGQWVKSSWKSVWTFDKKKKENISQRKIHSVPGC